MADIHGRASNAWAGGFGRVWWERLTVVNDSMEGGAKSKRYDLHGMVASLSESENGESRDCSYSTWSP